MEETVKTPSASERFLPSTLIWRLAQIVLILAACYLYILVGSFGGLLQRDRLFGNPHTVPLVKAVLVGLGIGVCIGLAIKDLRSGRVQLAVDWPTLIFNLLGAAAFVALSVALNVSAIKNTDIMRGPIKDAVILDPLVPFIWVGLALTSIVRSKPAPSTQ